MQAKKKIEAKETEIAEIAAKSAEVIVVASAGAPEASTPADAAVVKSQESGFEEPKVKIEESKAEEIKQAVPSAESVPEPEEPAPTDEELAEALRLLTPATGNADLSTIPTHGILVAAGQLLAEEAARNAASGPRWVAESVALSPEEAALSLEAEMFRTFAAVPAGTPTSATAALSVSASRNEPDAGPITGVLRHYCGG